VINKPLISILIPVYNMELYIERCLQSIVNQSYKNLEVIIVNDGSTDNSLNLINEFAKADSRIQVIDKKNEGIGGACADGLKVAQGDYISFVDSDDYCELDMYRILSDYIIKEDVDLIQFCDRHFNSKNETIGKWFDLKQILIKDNAEIIKHQFEVIKVPSLACKIFRRNLFDGIESLKQNIGIDHLITYQILLKSNSLLVIPDAFYNVYIRADSVSRSAYNESSINQSVVLFKNLIDMFQTKNNANLFNYILVHYINLIVVLGWSKYANSSKSELLDFIKNNCEFEKYYQMIPKNSEVVDFKFRVKTKLFKLSPYNYYRMYDLLKNKK
jgi:raffinose-raffinose alpha-galactotransferase